MAQKVLLRGKVKKVLSRAHVCLLEQRARNPHDQSEQTLPATVPPQMQPFWLKCLN